MKLSKQIIVYYVLKSIKTPWIEKSSGIVEWGWQVTRNLYVL